MVLLTAVHAVTPTCCRRMLWVSLWSVDESGVLVQCFRPVVTHIQRKSSCAMLHLELTYKDRKRRLINPYIRVPSVPHKWWWRCEGSSRVVTLRSPYQVNLVLPRSCSSKRMTFTMLSCDVDEYVILVRPGVACEQHIYHHLHTVIRVCHSMLETRLL